MPFIDPTARGQAGQPTHLKPFKEPRGSEKAKKSPSSVVGEGWDGDNSRLDRRLSSLPLLVAGSNNLLGKPAVFGNKVFQAPDFRQPLQGFPFQPHDAFQVGQ